jgi:hypothetical protein
MNNKNSESRLVDFGFLYGKSGPHTARTLMLDELSSLLEYVPVNNASLGSYRQAITEDNCLGKQSGKTRMLTFRHLRDLYSLNPDTPLFRTLLFFWDREPEGRALIAALCAFPRDPIFRRSFDWIVDANVGEQITRESIEAELASVFPDRYSPASLKSIAQNVNSSWTKTGHLTGKAKKIRQKATATPASTAYALYLAYISGIRGEELFHSQYCRILDTSPSELMEKAEAASRRGWIVMKRLGSVIEVLFPSLITEDERKRLHE